VRRNPQTYPVLEVTGNQERGYWQVLSAETLTRARHAGGCASGELEFRVMGPIEVLRDGGPLLVPGRTAIVVLAGLLLSPNRVVPANRLIDWRWGVSLPAHPRAALHSGVARLRRLLGDDVVETVPLGYRLRTEGAQLDMLCFRELVSAATAAAADGEAKEAAALLGRAVGLWRGAPLSNVDSPALIREAALDLTEQYLRAVAQRAALCLRLGLHETVVEELSVIVRQHPFHERLAGQLMIALMRGGRQADALATYAQLRRDLASELGIDPSLALRTLQAKILRADPSWDVATPDQQPDWLARF
jgi:DNA-binding SARP family transcriptional activator